MMTNPNIPDSRSNGDASSPGLVEGFASQLIETFAAQQALLQAQPALVQRFLEVQASQLAAALEQRLSQVRFNLPDRVVCAAGSGQTPTPVPAEFREQMAGGLVDRLTRTELRVVLRQRLAELEQSTNQAVATSANLIRHAIVLHLVHNLLPSGRTVTYQAVKGEEIPTLPVDSGLEPESALTAATDAIAGGSDSEDPADAGRGDLLVPYVPAARRFYLPQWVAFDDQGRLLVNSISAAEAHLDSMQHFLARLGCRRRCRRASLPKGPSSL